MKALPVLAVLVCLLLGVLLFSKKPTHLDDYKVWWAEVEKCTGITEPAATFDELQFYAVEPTEEEGFRVMGQGPFVGFADIWNKDIYLDRRFIAQRGVVKHEMIHQLLGRPGHGPMFDLCAY